MTFKEPTVIHKDNKRTRRELLTILKSVKFKLLGKFAPANLISRPEAFFVIVRAREVRTSA